MKKVTRELWLKEQPFDKFTENRDTHNMEFVHATGRKCYFDDGTNEVEYEDEIFENSLDIVTEYED